MRLANFACVLQDVGDSAGQLHTEAVHIEFDTLTMDGYGPFRCTFRPPIGIARHGVNHRRSERINGRDGSKKGERGDTLGAKGINPTGRQLGNPHIAGDAVPGGH